jgi:hypothetical protein
MTRLALRALLLVTFSLLAWAATASAECAWVLWTRQTEVRDARLVHGGAYNVDSTFATAHDCSTRLGTLVGMHTPSRPSEGTSVLSTPPTPERPNQGSVHLDFSSGKRLAFEFSCLPDTVDPRAGRRGSERHRRPPLAPLAPHQPRPARDAAHALERGGVG